MYSLNENPVHVLEMYFDISIKVSIYIKSKKKKNNSHKEINFCAFHENAVNHLTSGIHIVKCVKEHVKLQHSLC